MIRVFVLDDSPATRTATIRALGGVGCHVSGSSTTDHAGIKKAVVGRATIVLVSLPPAGGEVLPMLRSSLPSARVLVLADDAAENERACAEGADAVLPGSATAEEVCLTIRGLAAGHHFAAQPAPPRDDRPHQRPIPVAPSPGGPGLTVLNRLTPREAEMLELLSEGLTTPAIAKRLYLSRRTVEFHLARAYRKLGVRGRIDAIMSYTRLKRPTSV